MKNFIKKMLGVDKLEAELAKRESELAEKKLLFVIALSFGSEFCSARFLIQPRNFLKNFFMYIEYSYASGKE